MSDPVTNAVNSAETKINSAVSDLKVDIAKVDTTAKADMASVVADVAKVDSTVVADAKKVETVVSTIETKAKTDLAATKAFEQKVVDVANKEVASLKASLVTAEAEVKATPKNVQYVVLGLVSALIIAAVVVIATCHHKAPVSEPVPAVTK